MYLKNLIEELGVKSETGKAALAAVVFETLRSNKCGMTGDNTESVKQVLTESVCDRYTFDLMCLAATWCNDVISIMAEHEQLSCSVDDIFKDHVWPYLQQNEVVPGVRMK